MTTDVTVRDVMSRDFVAVSESDELSAVVELMRSDDVGSVVVVRGNEPVGIVTERAALTAAADGSIDDTTAGDVMVDPSPQITANASLTEAVDTMASRSVRQAIVLNGDELLGLLTHEDIVTSAASLLSGSGPAAEYPDETTPQDELTAPANEGEGAVGGTTSTQSICEICGSLRGELRNIDGQLVCADCRPA